MTDTKGFVTMKHRGDCRHDPNAKHDFSRSKTVAVDAFGTIKRRVVFCSFCGQERPTRKATR